MEPIELPPDVPPNSQEAWAWKNYPNDIAMRDDYPLEGRVMYRPFKDVLDKVHESVGKWWYTFIAANNCPWLLDMLCDYKIDSGHIYGLSSKHLYRVFFKFIHPDTTFTCRWMLHTPDLSMPFDATIIELAEVAAVERLDNVVKNPSPYTLVDMRPWEFDCTTDMTLEYTTFRAPFSQFDKYQKATTKARTWYMTSKKPTNKGKLVKNPTLDTGLGLLHLLHGRYIETVVDMQRTFGDCPLYALTKAHLRAVSTYHGVESVYAPCLSVCNNPDMPEWQFTKALYNDLWKYYAAMRKDVVGCYVRRIDFAKEKVTWASAFDFIHEPFEEWKPLLKMLLTPFKEWNMSNARKKEIRGDKVYTEFFVLISKAKGGYKFYTSVLGKVNPIIEALPEAFAWLLQKDMADGLTTETSPYLYMKEPIPMDDLLESCLDMQFVKAMKGVA